MSNFTKTVLLLLMTVILFAMLVQSSLDGQCMRYHADGARWTMNGVYCWRQGVFREYYRLDDLRAKHEGPKVNPTIKPTRDSGSDV